MKKILFAGIALSFLCAAVLLFWLFLVFAKLPDVATLKHYRPAAAAEVLDRDGRALTEYFDRKYRIPVSITSLPDTVIQAVVTAEDDTFFAHDGVNYKATWDALVHDMQKRRFARGGSTITQQMIKNVLLTREKTITRKLREYVLARKAEEILSKRQILQIYLNEVEWGDNIYGIEAASRFYFDKHAYDLSSAEAAMLAGMLPNPRYYNPYKRPDKAKKRQEQVLFNMHQAKLITPPEYQAGIERALILRDERSGRFSFPSLQPVENRPCYHYILEKVLVQVFGDQQVYRGGLKITTSLDKGLQDDLNRLEVAGPNASAAAPGTVTLIREGGKGRAILCSAGKETEIRERMAYHGVDEANYEITAVSRDSITRDMIILSVEGEKQPKAGSKTGAL